MASVWIKPRLTKSGPRFVVGYRLGGRGARQFHAASLTSLAQAEKLRDALRHKIAAGQIGTRHAEATTGRAELVYFAQLGDLIKIGVSLAPARRARDLNATLLHTESGGRAREREIHSAFAHARLAGEWFRDEPRIRRYLASRARALEAVSPTGGAEA